MSNDDRARSIRYQYLSQLQPGYNPQVPPLHDIAAEIARRCGLTLLVSLSGQAGVGKTTLAGAATGFYPLLPLLAPASGRHHPLGIASGFVLAADSAPRAPCRQSRPRR